MKLVLAVFLSFIAAVVAVTIISAGLNLSHWPTVILAAITGYTFTGYALEIAGYKKME